MPRTYLCIDLKTFYASVECVARGLDPFTTNLVVADPARTEKTICLAVSPAMKALGVRNRCRVFEIPKGIDYIMAKPRMRHYMEVSAQIYGIYLRYVSPEDIHAYSIDECFIDATPYLRLYGLDARSFAQRLMDAVRGETGIFATAGIGENLFLAKVALDIAAKRQDDGIGELDREAFLKTVRYHRPITDIWGIGPGIARRLEKYGVADLAGVAALDPDLLYREFGVNAEYLIDHAHGIEPCTIADIHAYVPETSSSVNGQVLGCPCTKDEARIVLKEMVDGAVLDLVAKHRVCGRVSLYVGYDHGGAAVGGLVTGEHGTRPANPRFGPHASASRKLGGRTASLRRLRAVFEALYDEIVDPERMVKRMHVGLDDLLPEELATVDLFTDVAAEEKEHRLQQAVLAVKGRFGGNALIKGMSLTEKATARERNEQVGGHHA